MKAFGVRLAAGAVTILMGGIMASQAQKDQQASTDSAWTEEQISPSKAVSPIGSTKTQSANPLVRIDPTEAETLKEFGAASLPDAPSSQGVVLVQHTESAAGMGLPESSSESESAADSAGGKPSMTMRMPSFDDAPSLESDSGADVTQNAEAVSKGPSFSMGLPVVSDTPAPASDPTKVPGIQFADTSGLSSGMTAGMPPGEIPAESGQPPANDLRGATPSPLREGSGGDTVGWETGATPAESEQPFSDGPSIGAPVITDSIDPMAGVPAAMLTPVLSGGPEGEPNELAEAPGSTMRIQRDAPVQLEIGGQPSDASSLPASPSTAVLGITSQPKIVGETLPGQPANGLPSNNATFDQPVGGTGSQGYAQPASGFDAPPLPAPGLPAAALPLAAGFPGPGAPATAFEAPPMQSQSGLPPSGSQAASYSSPGGRVPAGQISTAPGQTAPGQGYDYQGVGYKQPNAAPQRIAAATFASPGERFLDGPQSPSVVIHKRAPAEVKVGKPASFVITVKNTGGSKALDVQVHDRVPTGMTLTDATPRPNPKYHPELFWELGDLEPNQERTITLQLTPEQEGELGSVARVTFQAAASVRTISTRPELRIVQKAPEKVLIGQQLEIELEISNPGSGVATGVLLQEDVPDGLEHPQGKQLDNLIGTLGPGEVRRQILRMRAAKAGIVQNIIRVKGDDGLETTHTVAVEIVAPELKATLSGPSRRYLERQATYNLDISNVGTADATNVELSVQLDRGFTFVKTDFEGQYDSTRHAVFWSLPALPVGQAGKVPLTLLPVEEGNRVLRTQATADLGVKTASDSQVTVESLAELSFSINDSADPIEVGGTTTYEIRINNSGSRDDTNIKVAMQIPEGLQLVEQGDFTPQGQGIIAFSPRALLKANDEVVYTVKARGTAPGRHLVKAIVTSDQSDVPVTKEESIKVYSDQ
jgi:uncharacterized repeat protein (TIGR01451 family)